MLSGIVIGRNKNLKNSVNETGFENLKSIHIACCLISIPQATVVVILNSAVIQKL